MALGRARPWGTANMELKRASTYGWRIRYRGREGEGGEGSDLYVQCIMYVSELETATAIHIQNVNVATKLSESQQCGLFDI